MRKNIGVTDRVIRIIIALIIGILYFTNVITGTLGIVLLIVGAISLLTALINFCGLYALVGISTCPMKKAD
ncbi:MAG: DUF2892 domain-containing protein [Bacteroidales bacterium]|jgi:hypothetical protein|nr:DUF2892 domain-containing protein [Bacteroidales bacterium]